VKGGKAIPPLLTLSFRSRGLLAKFMMMFNCVLILGIFIVFLSVFALFVGLKLIVKFFKENKKLQEKENKLISEVEDLKDRILKKQKENSMELLDVVSYSYLELVKDKKKREISPKEEKEIKQKGENTFLYLQIQMKKKYWDNNTQNVFKKSD